MKHIVQCQREVSFFLNTYKEMACSELIQTKQELAQKVVAREKRYGTITNAPPAGVGQVPRTWSTVSRQPAHGSECVQHYREENVLSNEQVSSAWVPLIRPD